MENQELVHFETTGCRLNQIETEGAAKFFLDKNICVSLKPLVAKSEVLPFVKLCIFNTCAVTQKAEQKDRRIIHLLLKKCPNATIVVTGCYAELSGEKIEKIDDRIVCLRGLLKSRIRIIADLFELSFVNFSYNSEKVNLPFECDSEITSLQFASMIKSSVCAVEFSSKTAENPFLLNTDVFSSHSRSSIKIQDGCNNNCSYCTIHIARGKSVSMKAEDVVFSVQELEKSGQSEVVITCVNIAQYKSEYNGESVNFTKLLKLLLERTQKIYFRISSLYPEIVDDEFCSVVKNKRVRPFFHISVQSGSDKILKAMNRTYVANDVLVACRKLKLSKENAFISCDIITGFPDETDFDFEKTLELCKNCNFSWVHVFPFSERPGTLACNMKNKVPQRIRDERAKKLQEWAIKNKSKYISSCIGKEFSAVLETVRNGFFHALAENFLHCKITNAPVEVKQNPGAEIKVKITSIYPSTKGGEIDCLAEIVNL